jgi:hypothetical protein
MAKLIWVTTCPVPNGFEKAGPLSPDGKTPGRTSDVMERYLNPWAAEVVARYPQVFVCDQWQLVKDGGRSLPSVVARHGRPFQRRTGGGPGSFAGRFRIENHGPACRKMKRV